MLKSGTHYKIDINQLKDKNETRITVNIFQQFMCNKIENKNRKIKFR